MGICWPSNKSKCLLYCFYFVLNLFFLYYFRYRYVYCVLWQRIVNPHTCTHIAMNVHTHIICKYMYYHILMVLELWPPGLSID